ncbi:hypothetical protein A7K93_01420 [Candidatus Methylacidiphilum fumarolicum]|uniref:Uncharacterized protein n=2 Tax=Candidatus Methylacidiphilum fumarolicum TaxID=591154 RepID=I0JWD2_METFB|nr:hypothetical protein A7K73_10330 [Candidatus Methylacidiphilum fumarolicum]CCG91551.1 exported hypothetical protein [Methylacidiphilum fumariolicum SolV]TFE73360.1 hypothetical protein A7K72_06765 [Candidatus Methylacidiphilum fumarolicum]TFE75441.1 hypothetical protein A7K93_01420 [Candidatus Methylacidiphilum fumarolicum]TFE76664.1 hypothetical protein A7D33_08965 [Candidatus Methylacidiphilum fumarolicum]
MGFMSLTAFWTLAGPAPFVPSEAHDAGLPRLLYQIIYSLAVFPLAHPLVGTASTGAATYSIRVTSEDGLNSMIQAEVYDLTDVFMAQVEMPAFMTQCALRSGSSELAHSPAALPASGPLFLDFAKLLAVQPLDGALALPGND